MRDLQSLPRWGSLLISGYIRPVRTAEPKLSRIAAVWVMPTLLTFVAFYRYAPNSAGLPLSDESFDSFFSEGIYRYRIAGRFLVQSLRDAIAAVWPEGFVPSNGVYTALSQEFSHPLYCALALESAIFFSLTIFFVDKVLSDAPARKYQRLLITFVLFASLYTVTPYDMVSYALLSALAWLLATPSMSATKLLALGALMVLATLVRESSALLIPLYATMLSLRPRGLRDKSSWVAMGVLVVGFVVTYGALRIALGTQFVAAFVGSSTLRPAAILVSLLAAIFVLFASEEGSKKFLLRFVLLCTPYLGLIALAANPAELRLFAPILLLGVLGAAIHQGARAEGDDSGRASQ